MTRDDIIRMAREAYGDWYPNAVPHELERFAALVAAQEREKVAAWMIQRGYATGHGDTMVELLKELEWQIAERIAAEREACAMEADYEAARWPYSPEVREPCEEVAKAIRARGEK